MAQTINLNVRGLHTYASELSGVPAGALSVADDVNISRSNIVEPRRGFDPLSGNPTAEVKKLVFYDGQVLAHYGTTLGVYSGGAWVSRGTVSAPSQATSIRSAAIADSLFITSSTGIRKMDDTAASIYAAGIPKGTLIQTNGALTGSGTAIVVSGGVASKVAYRYLLARKDASGLTVFGGVSARLEVTTSTTNGTYDVPLRVWLPDGLDTTYFAQVYRTGTGTTDPNDELQLCYEQPLTGTNITNGYFDFTDICPEDLLGASLYTSPSQEGIVNDNAQPPLARDVAEFKNHLFFADVVSKYRYTFTLISVGGSSGVAVNDSLTISNGVTTEVYTGKASESVVNKEFDATHSGTVAQQIDATARSLVNIINQASDLVYAYLLSTGPGDLPGKIMLEERTYGGAAFTVVSNRATCWSPQLQSTANSNQTSSNDEYKNGLMFSKPGQPEAVPLKNLIRVGSSDDRIKRIVALRDGLFIFKEKDGIYVLRGENEASFSVVLLDGTAKVVAPDSLVPVNNLIYGLFDSGIGEVSDSGVSFIGLPIKDKILSLYGTAFTAVQTYGFGVGYDIDGKYILALPVTSADTSSKQQFVFDVFGRTWCRWTLNARSMGVEPVSAKLYYGVGGQSRVRIERKSYDYTDYVDFGNICTITSVSGTTLTINNTTDMNPGDLLVQGTASAYIETVNSNAGTVTIDSQQTWTTGTADVTHLKGIYCKVEWNPDFADNPAGFKQFYECSLLFKQGFQKEATVYFYTDSNPGESSVSLEADFGNGAWGEFVWGEAIWGGDAVKEPVRLGVPRPAARCNQLSVRFESQVAYSDFQLNGIALTYNPTSTRTAR